MNKIKYKLGEGLNRNIPKEYEDIISTVTVLYEKKKITIHELAAFAEKCDLFFQVSADEDLNKNQLMYKIFKEQTGFNKLTNEILKK